MTSNHQNRKCVEKPGGNAWFALVRTAIALIAFSCCAAPNDLYPQDSDSVFSDEDLQIDDGSVKLDDTVASEDSDNGESQSEESLPDGSGTAGIAPILEGVQELPAADAVPDDIGELDIRQGLPTQLEFELITERFPNGNVKIRRQVTQDENENYVNHGFWEEFDQEKNKVISGSYQFGERHGKWFRIVEAQDVELFSMAPYNQYRSEKFKSIASFANGKLDGKWTIEDASGRTTSEWNFVNGRRDGESVWYYNNGQAMRVINYEAGELNGALLEYDPAGNLLTDVEYINGRRLETATKHFENNAHQKQVEGKMLRARLKLKEPDDWWKFKLARYSKVGKDEKHGKWTAWYPNGKEKMTGEFQYDKPSGNFIWWHENGQKSLEATYAAGKKEGVWTWWHPNGLRSIRGGYMNGSPTDRWTWWNDTGKVSQRIDYSLNGAAHVVSPSTVRAGTAAWPSDQSIVLESPQN